jgi:hypothetical protein
MEIGHSMRDGCIVVRLAGQINLFGGRGLRLVERLATAWGVRRHADGKTVWCTVRLWRQPGPATGSGVGE